MYFVQETIIVLCIRVIAVILLVNVIETLFVYKVNIFINKAVKYMYIKIKK